MSVKGYSSWGNTSHAESLMYVEPSAVDTIKNTLKHGGDYLAYGMARSYGDCCISGGGNAINMCSFNHMLSFDEITGNLLVEGGVTLADILAVFTPRGWMLPVVPGTKFVTVGGAIANDVHGKNHHIRGTFGLCVQRLWLLRSDNDTIIECSPVINKELFCATIGGIGLTGIIVRAEIKLIQVGSQFVNFDTLMMNGLGDFFKYSAESQDKYDYTVSWFDCFSKNKVRGSFTRGNTASGDAIVHLQTPKTRSLTLPFNMPSFALNKYSIKTFNNIYYYLEKRKGLDKYCHFDSFFFPLDGINHWNRMYGKNGFYQFQCVIPKRDAEACISDLLSIISKSKQGSFLAVLKQFGSIKSPGMLSFPIEGVTLALDFPNRGVKTHLLLNELYNEVAQANGKVYLAKDALMSPAHFHQFYPRWREFMKYKDPRLNSVMWSRLTKGLL